MSWQMRGRNDLECDYLLVWVPEKSQKGVICALKLGRTITVIAEILGTFIHSINVCQFSSCDVFSLTRNTGRANQMRNAREEDT